MDIQNWSKARSKTVVQFARLGRGEPAELMMEEPPSSSSKSSSSRWKGKWKKFLEDKKKMFKSSIHHHHHVEGAPYDELTYAQNFDQGLAWDDGEPDGLITRSFSVRFADSRRFNIRRELISGLTLED